MRVPLMQGRPPQMLGSLETRESRCSLILCPGDEAMVESLRTHQSAFYAPPAQLSPSSERDNVFHAD